MDAESLIAMHPRIFHATSTVAWESNQEHGLLSTARLLELFGVEPVQRQQILTQKRHESVLLEAPAQYPALVRDQKPLKFVEEKIEADSSLEKFPTRDQLSRLLLAHPGAP